jgi:hypothetical protein
MRKVVLLLSLLAFICAGTVTVASAAGDQVCCKDGKTVTAKDKAACEKAGGKMVAKDQCKAAKKK